MRVDKSSPFSDKYWNVTQKYADDLMTSIEFLFIQRNFVLSSEDITNNLDLILPIGLISRISTQKSADFILRHFISKSNSDKLWQHMEEINKDIYFNELPKCIISHDNDKLPAKLLLLLSPFNSLQIPVHCVFDFAGDYAASLWFSRYYEFHTISLAKLETHKKMLTHQKSIKYVSEKWKFIDNTISSAYFGSSYVCSEGSDTIIKKNINTIIQNAIVGSLSIQQSNLELENSDKSLIIIVSQVWYKEHSVHRTFFKQISTLTPKYRLILIRFETGLAVNPELFEEVITISKSLEVLERFQTAAKEILSRKPAIIFFPDIGMSGESIYLANQRLAPIQVASYGHSVSTFGGLIDYWIGSKDVELLSRIYENYSEKLVLVDGLGITHTLPSYKPADFATKLHVLDKYGTKDIVIINISWAPMKTTSESLRLLKLMSQNIDSSKKVIFRLFAGMSDSQLMKEVFQQEINEEFDLTNVKIEVQPLYSFEEYMEKLREGDLFIDSWPYGGCNTVMDALFLNIPILTMRGTRWHNRIGPAQLELIGLKDLVAENEEEFISKGATLINNSTERSRLAEAISRSSAIKILLGPNQTPKLFRKAFDKMIENHLLWKKQDFLNSFIDLAEYS
eukprot:c21786_g1_i1.p1 GENE.c21786_g1_i1~~c21786_g1_i1.p1  ORF type:complete len:677 (-),score=155.68 c21786_g1_i1:33-1901(-)